MSQEPDQRPAHESAQNAPADPGSTPDTSIEESDPNADSPEGLAGEMGVSSERQGPVRGQAQEATYAATPTHPDLTDEAEDDSRDGSGDHEAAPEQSAYDGRPEVQPDNDVTPHPRHPQGNPGH